MLTTGDFDYRVVEIPAKYGEPIDINFIGDVHFNSPGFANDKFFSDMEEIKRNKNKNTYFINTGDTFEAMSTSERHTFSNSNLHESNKTRWERQYAQEIDDFVKHVSFMKHRTLGVFGGNHYFKFYDGTTSDQALASKLNAPYVGVCGYIILLLRMYGVRTNHCVKIFVHHGKSSGRTMGSTFGALEFAASCFVDADILIMGHDHKAGAMQIPAIQINRGLGGKYKVQERKRIIGRSGSYLKAYEPKSPSYAVDSLMRPSTLGYLKIILTPMRVSEGNHKKLSKTDHCRKERRWVDLKAVI